MKKGISFCALLLCLAAVTAVAFSSCTRDGGTEQKSFEPEVVISKDGSTVFTLRTRSSELAVALSGDELFLTSLRTESGNEMIRTPAKYALPDIGEDGSWSYRDYRSYDDGKGARGFVICFDSEKPSLTYELNIVSFPDFRGPFEFFGTVVNVGDGTVDLAPGEIFSVEVAGDTKPEAWRFSKESGVAEGYTLYWTTTDPDGITYAGTGIVKTVLNEGVSTFAACDTKPHWNTNGRLPMTYLDFGGEHGVYCALVWPEGRLDMTGKSGCAASVSVHIGGTETEKGKTEYVFSTSLPPHGSFGVPSVYLGAYDGDVDDGSNVFKRWFLKYKAPANVTENECEPLTQCDLMMTGAEAGRYGFESIKWDISWWSATGSWNVNESLVPRNPAHLRFFELEGVQSFSEYTAKLRESGVSLATYVLLRDSRVDDPNEPTSKGDGGHPEWFCGSSGYTGCADLGDTECVEFYKEYFSNFFASNGITTWRSDFGPIIMTAEASGVSANRHGGFGSTDISYWSAVGFGELVDYLIETVPGFRYESCSNGGSMKDLYTMTKATVLNCDDSADYMSLHMSFYDASYCIHPAQIQLPTVTGSFIPGNKYSASTAPDYVYGLRCSLVGGVMLNWAGEGGDHSYFDTYIPYYLNLYKNVMRPLIRNGDLYHILPRPDGVHWDGLEYFDPESDNGIAGMVMLWKPGTREGNQKTIKLRGLDPDVLYTLSFEDRKEQNTSLTGAQLMNDGLTVTIDGDYGSEIIWISRS